LPTIFTVSEKQAATREFDSDFWRSGVSLNDYFNVEGHVSLKDEVAVTLPEHIDDPAIANAFREGATCCAVQCWNAAGTMFRLCVDIATRSLLPPEDDPEINRKQRRDLGLRLPWLFDHNKLPGDLRELSACIHQDGNDAAHAGTLTKKDAEDLLDFTTVLLERLYTQPRQLELAKERREKRRKPMAQPEAKADEGEAD
jgi:hypothetical protein